MKITIHSTSKITTLVTESGSIAARIWEGETESGTPVHCFIPRIAPTISKTEHPNDPRFAEFERELRECAAPSGEITTIPLRLIL